MKNYNKLSVWLGLITSLLIVTAMAIGIKFSVDNYLVSYMDARAISSLVINCIAYGSVAILTLLFMVFSVIKNETNYSFHGVVMLVASLMFAITLIDICKFGVSLTHGWNEVQAYLITALCYLILGLGYLAIIFLRNNIKARRLIFILSIVFILLIGSMLVNAILDGLGVYAILLYSLIILSQVTIIIDCSLYKE